MYHEPAAMSGKLAVLLCNPFGYEAMCTHRSYLHLAHSLARRGLPATVPVTLLTMRRHIDLLRVAAAAC